MADERKEVKSTPEKNGPPSLPEDVNFDEILGDSFSMFGSEDKGEETPNEEPAGQKGNEQELEKEVKDERDKAEDAARDNDKKRYQYHQSRADRAENELNKAIELNQKLAKKLEELEINKSETKAASEADKKVEPPKEPTRPSYFSREEALTDPNSDSAKYLDARERWMKEMIVYNNTEVEQKTKQQAEEIKKFREELKQEKARKAMAAEQRQKLSALAKELKTKYDANDEQVSEFIQTMSKPDSLSLDNLWKLYAMQNGVGLDEGKSKEVRNSEPSDDFKQTKRAQGVPNPMGVLPGVSKDGGKSIEDLMMDKMIDMDPVDKAFD